MSMELLSAVAGVFLIALASTAQAQDHRRPTTAPATQPANSVLDFTVKSNSGEDVNLRQQYGGKVLLIVNVASKCGHTKQYAALERIYGQYKDQGLEVLAFPANDFGGQEPGSDADILAFCTTTYNVSFDLFSKIAAKGDAQAPLYRFLTQPESNPQFAGPIKWNFTKFLVDRNGQIIDRFEPAVTPDDPAVIAAIESALAK